MKCYPLELTNRIASKYPGCWDKIEKIRKHDTACYVPTTACFPICLQYDNKKNSSDEMIMDSFDMAVCASWRQHKQIYSFTPELAEILNGQTDDLTLPVEILNTLPYKCIFITIKDSSIILTDGLQYPGVFVFFDEYKNGETSLQIYFSSFENNHRNSLSVSLYLEPNTTVRDSVLKMLENAKKQDPDIKILKKDILFFQQVASIILQFVLYLCAENKEVAENNEQKKIYRKSSVIKDKLREVQIFDCGNEIAERVKIFNKNVSVHHSNEEQSGHGGPKSPHSRRGHWHHYWTGSRTGSNRKLILKWLAPTFVNGGRQNQIDINIVK